MLAHMIRKLLEAPTASHSDGTAVQVRTLERDTEDSKRTANSAGLSAHSLPSRHFLSQRILRAWLRQGKSKRKVSRKGVPAVHQILLQKLLPGRFFSRSGLPEAEVFHAAT